MFLVILAGCERAAWEAPKAAPKAAADRAAVAVVTPKRVALRLSTSGPARIEALEQTPIYPKITGYVQNYVDIGDVVKEGQVLAELFVPELVKEHELKEQVVKQMEAAQDVAVARVQATAALVKEAQAGVVRAEANQERWQLEYGRISKLAGTVLDIQTKEETWNQLQSAKAGWKEVQAKVESAQAAVKESEAALKKAAADVAAAQADRDRVAALVSYARLTAPFPGIVTRRNVNKWTFVQPPAAGKGEPLFVVERREQMRVFVEVREADAAWVAAGAKALVRVPALQNREIQGQVTRTSYALDRTAHTLLAEIDLPNPKDELRPNMYAFAVITAESTNILALPNAALITLGEITSGYQTFYFTVRDGKAERVRVQTGRSDKDHTEVLQKQKANGDWEPFSGTEVIIANPPANLSAGQAVEVAK